MKQVRHTAYILSFSLWYCQPTRCWRQRNEPITYSLPIRLLPGADPPCQQHVLIGFDFLISGMEILGLVPHDSGFSPWRCGWILTAAAMNQEQRSGPLLRPNSSLALSLMHGTRCLQLMVSLFSHYLEVRPGHHGLKLLISCPSFVCSGREHDPVGLLGHGRRDKPDCSLLANRIQVKRPGCDIWGGCREVCRGGANGEVC